MHTSAARLKAINMHLFRCTLEGNQYTYISVQPARSKAINMHISVQLPLKGKQYALYIGAANPLDDSNQYYTVQPARLKASSMHIYRLQPA